jgi:two-component system, LytTR family, response regulator
MTVLIADDEPPARRYLRSLLAEPGGGEILGEARSGVETVAAIRALRPDVIFLDVQMPEGSGFDVLRELGPEGLPVVVFATAYDTYALRAFEANALDYLLKPFDRARFEMALHRALDQVRRLRGEVDPRLLSLFRDVEQRARSLDRIPIRNGVRTRLIDADVIDYLEAQGNYVQLHAGKESHLVRETLGALEEKLDPRRFLRVHRSLIVNLDRIVEVESLFAGEYVLFLRDGRRLTTGRSYRARVQEALRLRG